jgi:hypothetical protein
MMLLLANIFRGKRDSNSSSNWCLSFSPVLMRSAREKIFQIRGVGHEEELTEDSYNPHRKFASTT